MQVSRSLYQRRANPGTRVELARTRTTDRRQLTASQLTARTTDRHAN